MSKTKFFITITTLGILLFLTGCASDKIVVVHDACGVLDKTLYSDGQFKFSPDEIAALSDTNQVKLDSVKRYHRKDCSSKPLN